MICSPPSKLAAFAAFAFCLLGTAGVPAQAAPAQVLARPEVQKAMEVIRADESQFIELQIRLCEIAAPPFHEDKRGAEMAALFKSAGLQNVRTDAVGNVLGDRPGAQPHPHLVMAAHLDTVFPPETNVKVTREGNLLKGPGIGDDCRGLAALLAIIHSLSAAHLKTQGTVTFVANVGEEGPGDLRGTRELFNNTLKGQIDDFISIEPGPESGITNGGVGSYRYRVTFTGPGGHSYGAFGLANPAGALGRAIAHIGEIQVPTQPKTTFNVGLVGGGTSVNSIPFEAWMEFDERSTEVASLDELDKKFQAAVHQGLDEENARWHDKGKLSVTIKKIGVRPAGQTEASSALVTTAVASIEALGFGKARLGASSTDSNVPMNLHIPAITIGGGGRDTGSHSLNETDDVTDSWKGPQNALLTLLSLLQ